MNHTVPRTPDITFEVNTVSPEETRALARNIGSRIKSGIIIGLDGELGAGKTEFVKGFAAGAGVSESTYITSPTYSIINQYNGRLPFYHLDLYRLSEPDELYHTGFEDILSENAVIVVEWPEIMGEIAETGISVVIQVTGITERKITFFAYGLANSNLIQDLANHYKEKEKTWD
jgi:tRNA threonylcarbamoyladenosine biosynthesis protein TsaE